MQSQSIDVNQAYGKMSAEERVAYVDAKNEFDKARFKSLEEGKASKEDFDALKNEIHEQTKQD